MAEYSVLFDRLSSSIKVSTVTVAFVAKNCNCAYDSTLTLSQNARANLAREARQHFRPIERSIVKRSLIRGGAGSFIFATIFELTLSQS